MGENEPRPDLRLDHYKRVLREVTNGVPSTFKEFVGNSEIIEFGDHLIEKGLSTGYNFGRESEFPMWSEKPVIVYNNYIQRIDHFARLLATMEAEGLIEDSDITYGFKASKVLGYWGDPEAVKEVIVRNGVDEIASSTVELLVIFHPTSINQAILIAEFLQSKVFEGSWAVPDVRAPDSKRKNQEFINKMSRLHFRACSGNVYSGFPEGKLVALRQETVFKGNKWSFSSPLVNDALYDWLRDDVVGS